MRIAGVIFADFEESNPGGPSQLRTAIRGHTIIVRTLRRFAKIEGLCGRYLLVRPRDRDAGEEAIRTAGVGSEVQLLPADPGLRPARELVRTARKWALRSWRGNPLALTWFDEFVDPPTVALVLDQVRCDAVLCLDGHMPLLDPVIGSAMVGHMVEHEAACKVVFTQAPPGLAGVIIRRECAADLVKLAIPFGLLLSYRPEIAQSDPIIHPSCYHVPTVMVHTAGRFTADTRASRELVQAAIHELGDWALGPEVCHWYRKSRLGRPEALPNEVEIELTTDDPLPDTTLRPRGNRVPRRELSDLAAVDRIAAELAEYDDRLVVLGGHGDPLSHSQFSQVVARLRGAGVYGIALVTPLLKLTDENLDAIFAHHVDAIEVLLDAHSPVTYAQVHGINEYARVVSNISRLEEERRRRQSPWPVIVPSLIRCSATIAEMEEFYDHWIKSVGSAVIRGYRDYCGSWPPDSLLPTRPPVREHCRRLATRMMLLADGNVPACSEDYRGETSLGNWSALSLASIWNSDGFQSLRRAHADLCLEAFPLCQRCGEWFRR